jgi:hypothetical protein
MTFPGRRSQSRSQSLTRETDARIFKSSVVAIDRHSPRWATGHVEFASAQSPLGQREEAPDSRDGAESRSWEARGHSREPEATRDSAIRHD